MFGKNRLFSSTMFYMALVVASSGGSTVLAQESEETDKEVKPQDNMLEEVVVTATYRATNLMDTSSSISAISEDFIKEMAAGDMGDLYQYVPGLNMTQAAAGNNRYVVRGVTSQTGESPLSITASAVGVYLGEVPVTSSVGSSVQMNSTLFDVERVEVLKGPQGTLFGEGSQGGTIRYIFNKPDLTGFDANVTAGYNIIEESSDSGHKIEGMLNFAAIEDKLAFRMNIFDTSQPGWIDNKDPYEKDFNDSSAQGGRFSFLYQPNDKFSMEGSWYTVEQESNGIQRSDQNYVNDSGRTPGNPPHSEDDFDVYNLLLNYDFGWANLTSSTSYTERTMLFYHEYSKPLVQLIDLVFTFNTGIDWPKDVNTLGSLLNRNRVITERKTQEFRLVSPGDQRFRWTTGVFFKDSDDLYDFYLQAATKAGREDYQYILDGLFTPEDPNDLVGSDGYKEWAVFAEASYDITEQWEFTLGGRYTDMKQTLSDDEGAEDSPFTPKAVISWRPNDDLLIYGSYAEGFRQGNVNRLFGAFTEQRIQNELDSVPGPDPERRALLEAQLVVAQANKTFDGDTLVNWELGIKTPLFDGRASLAASLYYVDWQNLIQEYKDPILIQQAPNDTYNANLGDATAMGAEIEYSMVIGERWFWRIGGDYNKTEVKGGANDGNELIWAPGFSVTTGLDYTFPIGTGLEMTLHGDYNYVDEQWVNGLNTLLVPSYNLGNISVILRGMGKTAWRANLYVKNATNADHLTNYAQLQSDTFYARPRQVGVEVGWDFR
jgi:outer membrane receptor protein involved in Fe transport